ncbi:ankyrin repeat-containing domain protein [Trichophaea hybrida]|nr:ankyrin repeat-containing domain protein [Trichophaea hybrida]
MDPFTVATGLAGFLSLTIEIKKILEEYISGVKSAPDNSRKLLTQIAALSHVLQQLVMFLRSEDAKGTSFDQTSVLCSVIAVCQGHVEQLYRKLEKLSSTGKNKKGVERLKWPFNQTECQQTVEMLHRCAQTFEFSLSISSCALLSKSLSGLEEEQRKLQQNMEYVSQMIGQVPDKLLKLSGDISTVLSFAATIDGKMRNIFLGVQDLQRILKDDEIEKLLRWLSPLEPQKRHQDIRQQRLENTGEWLLEMTEFRAWRDGQERHKSVIVCYGIPGAGKTVIRNNSSLIVDHLSAQFPGKTVGVACLYCDYRDQTAQNPVNMLGGLLKQFLMAFPNVPEEFIEVFNRNKHTNLNLSMVCDMLKTALRFFHCAYICIDALDECDSYHRKTLLESLRQVVDKRFLLPALQIQAVLEQLTITKRRNALRQMPKGLRDAFASTIERILRQSGAAELAVNVLKWTFLAQRPMQVEELRHALAVNWIDTNLDWENFVSEQCLLSCCLGLVIIDEGASTVRLVHLSLQEYLLSQQEKLFPMGHCEIAQTCLTYINFDIFKAISINLDKQVNEYIFLHYAIHNWGHHARIQTTMSLEVLGLTLLQHPTTGHYMSRALFNQIQELQIASPLCSDECKMFRFCGIPPMVPDYWKEQALSNVSFCLPGLHVAVYFGLTSILRLLIDSTCDLSKDSRIKLLNSQNLQSRTPLAVAAKYGHDGVVRLLLERDEINVNTRGGYWHETPLSCAAGAGHDAIVRMLLARKELEENANDTLGAVLWKALKNGHEVVVGTILERDKVDVNLRDAGHETPLLYASSSGNEEMVRLMLQRDDVNVNAKDWNGDTSLWNACRKHHLPVIRALLRRQDIDINVRDFNDDTPLHFAAKYGDDAILRSFLRWDTDLNATNRDNDTPFWCALRQGHEAVVRILLEQVHVDVNRMDLNGCWTPLSYAADTGNEPAVRLLLERDDIHLNTAAPRGIPPISHAADRGHKSIIRLFLERDNIDVNAKSWSGQTPLSHAAETGYGSVVQLLALQDDVDINARDQDGNSPLLYAARNGHEAVVRVLLERNDVSVNIKGWLGKTPLSWAAENGNERVVQLLLERDDIDREAKEEARERLVSYNEMIRQLLELDQILPNRAPSPFPEPLE